MPVEESQGRKGDADVARSTATLISLVAQPARPELVEVVRLLTRQAAREYYESQRKGVPSPGS